MSPEERLLLQVEADEVAARARADFVRNRLRAKATSRRASSAIVEPSNEELVDANQVSDARIKKMAARKGWRSAS